MPSFEETNQADQNNPDFQYKPGNQNDLEKSDVVVKNSAEEPSTEAEPIPAKQEKRTEVPAELKPDVLDASIPLPKPAPLQKTKVEKVEDPDAAKKPNLRSRWKSDPSNDSEKKAQSFGQVDDLTDVQENLSGRQSRPPEKRAKQTTSSPTEGDRDKPEHNDETNEHREARPKRSRNRNRKKRSDSQDRDENKRSERNSSPAKKTARKQARKKTKASNKSAQKPKVEQPVGIVGKIVKTIKSFFGGVEESKPEPSRPQRKGPAKKRARNNKRRQSGKPQNNAEGKEDRPPAKKRTRRRKRPNNKRRRDGENTGNDSKSDTHPS